MEKRLERIEQKLDQHINHDFTKLKKVVDKIQEATKSYNRFLGGVGLLTALVILIREIVVMFA